MSALVSVILPVYNGAQFVAEAVESVLGQTYVPLELIVIDDGSTDTSVEVLARYPDIRLIRQENAGVAAARNRGVAEASGKILAFIDQDDRWRPDKLDHQLDYLNATPNAGFVLGQMRTFLEPGMEPPSWLNPVLLDSDTPGLLPGTFVIRRSFFETIGPFNEEIETASDSEWLLRAYSSGDPGHVVPEVVLDRRVHSANQSSQATCTAELLDVLHAFVLQKKRRAAATS